jgi:hypothetical protein
MTYETELADSERDALLEKLSIWAHGHQTPRKAFMTLMGHTFSPIEFYDLVRQALGESPRREQGAHSLSDEQTPDPAFGRGFVSYLREQSRRHDEPLTASLERAIRATQVRR